MDKILTRSKLCGKSLDELRLMLSWRESRIKKLREIDSKSPIPKSVLDIEERLAGDIQSVILEKEVSCG